ncbi:hypothetical protein M0657_004344 [Pyricularia oryzae]|nr:hypothetical protein M9X92_005325 [Pyricularia oryzae]KAI7925178.1 hypothetical protein M0657_004344 [Pyricularia oryzae]
MLPNEIGDVCNFVNVPRSASCNVTTPFPVLQQYRRPTGEGSSAIMESTHPGVISETLELGPELSSSLRRRDHWNTWSVVLVRASEHLSRFADATGQHDALDMDTHQDIEELELFDCWAVDFAKLRPLFKLVAELEEQELEGHFLNAASHMALNKDGNMVTDGFKYLTSITDVFPPQMADVGRAIRLPG